MGCAGCDGALFPTWGRDARAGLGSIGIRTAHGEPEPYDRGDQATRLAAGHPRQHHAAAWLLIPLRPMRFSLALLAVLCGLVLFTGLTRTGFLDTREARDGQVAREVAAKREVITPLLGAEPLFEKPILAYGPDATLRVLSRHPELYSRILRAVVAVLLVMVVGSTAAVYFGARAGVIASGVLLTCFALPHAARMDGTQLLATLFAWLGVVGFADALFDSRGGRSVRLVFAYSALGLAFVTGGPLPALWPLGAVALYLGLRRRNDLWARIQPLAGLTLVIGMSLPWYGAMIERHGAQFLKHVAFFPYAAEPRGPIFSGPLVMLSYVVIGLFPWSTLLPGAILHAATWWRTGGVVRELERVREGREEYAAHFFVACLVAAAAPLLFYPTPPLTAILPAAPAAALLCSRLLDHAFENVERVRVPIARATMMLALVGTMSAIMVVLAAAALRGAATELRLVGTVLFATSWAPLLANFMGRRMLAALLLVLPVAIGTPVVAIRLLPALEDYLSTRPVARAMETAAPERATLVLLEPPPPTLRLYGEHNLVVADTLSNTLLAERAADGLAYLAFRPAREHDAARGAASPLEILLRTPALVLARVEPRAALR